MAKIITTGPGTGVGGRGVVLAMQCDYKYLLCRKCFNHSSPTSTEVSLMQEGKKGFFF